MELPNTPFIKLIAHYADGRQVCNCGQAYYSNCGTGSVFSNGVRVLRHDLPACKNGCEVNLRMAKDYIAQRVVADLGFDNEE